MKKIKNEKDKKLKNSKMKKFFKKVFDVENLNNNKKTKKNMAFLFDGNIATEL